MAAAHSPQNNRDVGGGAVSRDEDAGEEFEGLTTCSLSFRLTPQQCEVGFKMDAGNP
jgi:hypothetical protein